MKIKGTKSRPLAGGVATMLVLALGMSVNPVEAKPPKSTGLKATHIDASGYRSGWRCNGFALCTYDPTPHRITAKLTGDMGSAWAPLAGRTLEFVEQRGDLLGNPPRVVCKVVTDTSGFARCSLDHLLLAPPLGPGNYIVRFQGDSQFAASGTYVTDWR